MSHASGELTDRFKLLRLMQGRFDLEQTRAALLHPLLQCGIELRQLKQPLAHRSVSPGALDMRPRTLRHLTQQRQLMG